MRPFQFREPVVTARNRRACFGAVACLAWVFVGGIACVGRVSAPTPAAVAPTRGGAGAGATTTGGAGASGTAGTTSAAGSTGAVGPMGAAGSMGVAGSTGAAGSGSGGAPPVSACNGTIKPGRSPLRRLNAVEYDNTVQDLMNVKKVYSAQFPPDEEGLGFSNNADALVVNNLLAEGYQVAAEEMAAAAVMNLGALAPACNATTMGNPACAMSFIQAYGKKTFRRVLTSEEATRYLGLFTTGSIGATYNDGISLVIEAMLQSPNFLYRYEVGVPMANATVVPLTGYELATRLSYFIWGSMPDSALFTAADANQLSTTDQLTTQVKRMLNVDKVDRAHKMVGEFHREWLYFMNVMAAQKSIAAYPTWKPELAVDLLTESDTFAEEVFWKDGNVNTLITAPYSYMNAAVARHYGLPAPSGTGFVKVNLDPTQRSGILTLGAFLAGEAKADQSSPVLRGKFVREQLLCQHIQPPPNDVVIIVPEVTPGTSARQRFTAHAQAQCSGCHLLMDQLGFGFENFDAVGNWRTTDGGMPVDATGQIVAVNDSGTNGPFNGVVELGKKLAASSTVKNCVATQWFRWGNGRAETTEDACSLEVINKQFQVANYDMRTLPVAIATADAFRYRKVGGAP